MARILNVVVTDNGRDGTIKEANQEVNTNIVIDLS